MANSFRMGVLTFVLIAAGFYRNFVCGEPAAISFQIRSLLTGVGIPGVFAEFYRHHGQDEDEDDTDPDVPGWELLSNATTSITGKAAFNLTAEQFSRGTYRLVYYTQPYWDAQNMSTFFPYCETVFRKKETNNTVYIVPTLAAPYGYTSYKGKGIIKP